MNDRGGLAVKKPHVQLSGSDGNVFTIIGKVHRALKDANQPEAAEAWRQRAFACHSYEEVIALTFEYVDPS